ncbi:MAG: DUF2399 domain-containing protein [Bifidobacteriaceae bacterium]|nr:DUF2399 domain-containing protein [Bifidobacteriaceae bacterium]
MDPGRPVASGGRRQGAHRRAIGPGGAGGTERDGIGHRFDGVGSRRPSGGRLKFGPGRAEETIFVCENPAILEAAALALRARPVRTEAPRACLICLFGQPSAAATAVEKEALVTLLVEDPIQAWT